jgi:hypothetical protein
VEFLLVGLTTLFASLAMGLTGFGFGLVAMGILPFVMTVADANAVVVVLGLVVATLALLEVRRHVQFGLLWPLWLGSLIGVPLGVVYLVRLPEPALRLSLGLVILIAIGATFLRGRASGAGDSPDATGEVSAAPASGRRVRLGARTIGGRLAGVLVGVAGGALGGAFSVGGPPVVIYFGMVLTEKTEIKASLLAYFVFTILVRTPLLLAEAVITPSSLLTSALALPFLLTGLFAGSRLHNRLASEKARIVIMILLAVSAAGLILDGL